MGQTRNNNLSPLPFYRSVAEQQCRLPWAFGDVFPLRCDNRLLPFFFTRGEYVSPASGEEIGNGAYFDGYLDIDGNTYTPSGWTASGFTEYDLDGTTTEYWVENLPAPVTVEGTSTVNVVCNNAEGTVLRAFVPNVGNTLYSGVIEVPAGTVQLYLQSYIKDGENATLHKVVYVPTPIDTVKVFAPDGEEVADISTAIIPHIHLDNVNKIDVIWYGGDAAVLGGLPSGTYYLHIVSGFTENYSEMFTYGAVPNVRLEWNDISDLSLPDGKIPYSQGYVNRVWLNTAVGRPEYEIEKEGDERDGYFFMEKGISRKSYRMTFFAPEYLCDALRLVPVSDVVKIWDTSLGASVEYDVDDVDMEVEWLEQGNYASVTITFHTDTVVKNLGKII
jgi:hypothetical protein